MTDLTLAILILAFYAACALAGFFYARHLRRLRDEAHAFREQGYTALAEAISANLTAAATLRLAQTFARGGEVVGRGRSYPA